MEILIGTPKEVAKEFKKLVAKGYYTTGADYINEHEIIVPMFKREGRGERCNTKENTGRVGRSSG
jgi:hypothetical protein